MKSTAPTLRQFQDRFPTEDSCLDHLFRVRYGADFNCPKCERPAKYSRVKGRRAYQCNWCANQLYPTAGTPFDKTRTSLRDWFYVMFLFTTTRNGVAAKRVEREIGVTYKTAWRMCDQIRKYTYTHICRAKEGRMAAQLKEPELAPVHLVRRKTFDKIAENCTRRGGDASGLIKFVNATMALSKQG